MKYQPVRQCQTTTPGTMCPTLFDKCMGSFKSPAKHVTLKMQETGTMVYSPYLSLPNKSTGQSCYAGFFCCGCWVGFYYIRIYL